jgi:hypothetical protein
MLHLFASLLPFHERLCFATASGIHPAYKIAIDAFFFRVKMAGS